jgi:hypothetical protein
VASFAARINEGDVDLLIKGYIRWSDTDDGGYVISFNRADATSLGTVPASLGSDNMVDLTGSSASSSGWEYFSRTESVPAYTEQIIFCITSKDLAPANGETDVYFDDLSLKLE